VTNGVAHPQNYRVATAPAKPLRLLLVTARFFPFTGGVENHVYQVARRLVQRGVDVSVLTTDLTGDLPPTEIIEGAKVHRVRAFPANRDFYFAPALAGVISAGKWDIVHIQCYHTLVPPIAMLASLLAKVPYVLTFHGGGHSLSWRNAIRGVQRRALQPLFARATKLIATARFEIDLFGRRLGIPTERFAYIPNGGDLKVPEQIAQAPTNGTLIASVGRLEKYKGHQRVIAALPEVLKRRPDARVWIAGDGPYEGELRQLAEHLGVSERVEIRGVPALERARFAEQLSQASLMTLLSEYETHPMAAMEAVALGVPVLVANTSGLSELADDGLARAIDLKATPRETAVAMLHQIENPLRPTEINLPSWDRCTADLHDLYLSIAQTQGAMCVS
jgi:glycosyltransferase involved in cell wall biosynthesis